MRKKTNAAEKKEERKQCITGYNTLDNSLNCTFILLQAQTNTFSIHSPSKCIPIVSQMQLTKRRIKIDLLKCTALERRNAIHSNEICIKFHIGFEVCPLKGRRQTKREKIKNERKTACERWTFSVAFHFLEFICKPVCRQRVALDARWMLIFIIIISLRIIFHSFRSVIFRFHSVFSCPLSHFTHISETYT